MQRSDLFLEAQRQLEICNACRYCEGYCAVFPALERRRSFDEGDIIYLSNLCHDCRDCYTACMYAPPHEFKVNIPALLSEVRLGVYEDYSSPRALGRSFRQQIASVGSIVFAALLLTVLLVVAFDGPDTIFTTHRGPGSFYIVIPYLAMFIPAMVISLLGIGTVIGGLVRYWRDTGARSGRGPNAQSFLQATWQSLTLTFLRGGGSGCDYPGETESYSRLVFHSFVAYGFLAAFAATIAAAIEQDIFDVLPPYPILSAPVLLGIVGGIGLIVGATGLAYLKAQSTDRPAFHLMTVADYVLLVLLDLIAVTGLLLLVFRGSAAMGALLTLHVGLVLGAFLTAPYGKFVHWVYRYLALIQNRIEESAAE